MKKIVVALAVALAFSSAPAKAQSALVGVDLHLIPQLTAPANLGVLGNVGLWTPSGGQNASLPTWRLSGGSDLFIAGLNAAQTYTKTQNVALITLTDQATIATDASTGNVFAVTLGANRTLGNPTGLVSGGTYLFIITQSTGGQTLNYGNLFKFPAGVQPTLSTGAGAVDLLSCFYNGTILGCTFTPNFS